tara:strand:+ start:3668 stop:4456 length:789 start_codon:yes stop_codon:yes gene_type:complete
MDHILDFWNNQADTHKTSHSASWGDLFMVEIERDFIAKQLKNTSPNNVLDCGTSNGHSLIDLAKEFPNIQFAGFDFSESMVGMFKSSLNKEPVINISTPFKADIRDLSSLNSNFDFIFTTRVLINLPTWEEQKEGLNQMLNRLSKGGKLIIMEGFWEPLCNLNSLRLSANLQPLREHDFNRYLKKEMLEIFLSDSKLDFVNVDFSSTYYLLTRFVRETIGADKFDQAYTSSFNLNAKKLHNDYFDYARKNEFGIQQAYIITK